MSRISLSSKELTTRLVSRSVHSPGPAGSRDCGHLLGGGTWLVYDETPIEARVTVGEGMVSVVLGEDDQLRIDFLDPDPLDRFVEAAKQARKLFRAIPHCPLAS